MGVPFKSIRPRRIECNIRLDQFLKCVNLLAVLDFIY